MAKKSWSSREYFELGMADLDGLGLPIAVVVEYCRLRRIEITGLVQNENFSIVMSGAPMFHKAPKALRKKCKEKADELLTMLGLMPDNNSAVH